MSEDKQGFPLGVLTILLGPDHAHHLPTIIHLVVSDAAYTDWNGQTVTDVVDYGTCMCEYIHPCVCVCVCVCVPV